MKNYWLLSMFFCIVAIVPAQEWNGDFRSLGLTPVESETLADGTMQGEFLSRTGIPVTAILGPGRVEWKDDFQKILTAIEDLEFIDVQRIQMVLDTRRSEAIFQFSRLTYPQAATLVENVLSGIYFYLNEDGKLFYSLRMLVGDYVLRVAGQYLDEESLLRRLIVARSDPEEFLRSQDPEVVFELLERIENHLYKIEDMVQTMREGVYSEEGGLQNLENRIDRLNVITADLDTALAETREMLAVTDRVLLTFLEGSIPLFSKGWGKPVLTSSSLIDTVIQTIKENPQLTNAELRRKLRDEQDLRVSSKLMYTIRSVYFGRPEADR